MSKKKFAKKFIFFLLCERLFYANVIIKKTSNDTQIIFTNLKNRKKMSKFPNTGKIRKKFIKIIALLLYIIIKDIIFFM